LKLQPILAEATIGRRLSTSQLRAASLLQTRISLPRFAKAGGTVVRALPGLDIGAGGKRYYIISRVD